jgi:hypothetical protein
MPLSCFLGFPWVFGEMAAQMRTETWQSTTEPNKSYTSDGTYMTNFTKLFWTSHIGDW